MRLVMRGVEDVGMWEGEGAERVLNRAGVKGNNVGRAARMNIDQWPLSLLALVRRERRSASMRAVNVELGVRFGAPLPSRSLRLPLSELLGKR